MTTLTATPPVATTPRHQAAWWGFGLAAAYAIFVRFYQAAGGSIGMSGEMRPEHAADTEFVSYLAGLLTDEWLWIDETSSAWWDLAFYEPWFLALGVVMHMCVRRYLRDTGRASVPAWVTRVSAVAAAVFAGIGIWMVVTDNLWIV